MNVPDHVIFLGERYSFPAMPYNIPSTLRSVYDEVWHDHYERVANNYEWNQLMIKVHAALTEKIAQYESKLKEQLQVEDVSSLISI